jgi:hypothetical protein
MKTLSSSVFRKVYPSLDEPTEVTALGRLIGTWFPVGQGTEYPSVQWRPLTEEAKVRFNTQPFTGPIPKSGRKK